LAAKGITFDATVTRIEQGVVNGGENGSREYGGRGAPVLPLTESDQLPSSSTVPPQSPVKVERVEEIARIGVGGSRTRRFSPRPDRNHQQKNTRNNR
jgi:hypothetical protein